MIRQRLLELPEEIMKLKIDILFKQEQAEQLREELKQWEIEQIYEIVNATDERGKAIYSNDDKRKSELERRKVNDQVYQEKLDALKLLEHDIQILQIRVERLYNEQGNLRSICRLEGGSNDE